MVLAWTFTIQQKGVSHMHHLVYFDLSPQGTRMPLKSGTYTSLEELLPLVVQANPEVSEALRFSAVLARSRFEPTPQWEKTLQMLVLAISGRLASVHDLKNMRRLLYVLPNGYKRSFEDPWQAIGLLAYLLVGFKMHPASGHKEDANSVRDLAEFAMQLADTGEAHLSSFLCSHRGPSIPGGSWLAQDIPYDQIRRALHLQLALLSNAHRLQSCSVVWAQQGPSLFASGTLFPELFLRYAEQGLVPDMLLTLAKQEQQIKNALVTDNPTTIPTELRKLDPFVVEILRFMRSTFGPDWRSQDFQAGSDERTPLLEIALSSALPEVKRLMPFYANGETRGYRVNQERWIRKSLDRVESLPATGSIDAKQLQALTCQTIRWFLVNQMMHPTAKALYETVFYYLWGKRCAQTAGQFAIGLDRDHSEFQQAAWKLGYREAYADGRSGVVLYARRVERPNAQEQYLNNLTFRQFWR